MKKLIKSFVCVAMSLLLLCACGSPKSSGPAKEYKASMEKFFDNLNKVNTDINSINPEDQNAVSKLFEQFDVMEKEITAMSQLTVPTEGVPETFAYIEELAKSASDYMTQANGYLHDSFSEGSYNEHTLEASMECYKRANKRIQYIITLLHGEYPSDDTISFGK